jgi:hypothetical protein
LPENSTTGKNQPAETSADDPRFRGKRYRQLVAAFNDYRSPHVLEESTPLPSIHTAFRGVPFTCSADVLEVGNGKVTFSIDKLQAKVVERTGTSLIMSPLHGMTFKVVATHVDADQGRVSFAQFLDQQRGSAEQRSHLRVEPEQSIYVKMRCLGKEVAGSLLDVSVVSLAASFPETDLENIDEGTPVDIFIPELPPEIDMSLKAEGEIIRTVPLADKDSQSRGVVVTLRIHHELYDRLNRYVELRRVAIIRELSDDDSPSGAVDEKVVSD